MSVKEPGVVVFISGQQLPPPLPPTSLGIGTYIDAVTGPYKLRFVTIRDYSSVYTRPHPALNSELSFLFPITSLNCMMLPGLHLKESSGFVAIKPPPPPSSPSSPPPSHPTHVQNFIAYLNSSTRNRDDVFLLPSWLDGIPRVIGFFDDVTISNLPSNFSDLSLVHVILRYDGKRYVFHTRFDDNSVFKKSYVDSLITPPPPPSDWYEYFDMFRIVVHKTQSNFIVWFYHSGNNKNYVLYFKRISSTSNDYTIYVWGDDVSIFTGNLNFTFRLENTSSTTGTPVDFSFSVNFSAHNNPRYMVRGEHYDILYVTPDTDNTAVNITSNGNLVIDTVVGTSPVTFTYEDFSYSPLDSGYYGFIKNNTVEMFISGDIYDTSLETGSVVVSYNTNSRTITTPFYFHDRRHIGALHNDFFDIGPRPSVPDYAGTISVPTASSPVIYKYVYKVIYDTDSKIIQPYNSYQKYHQNLIYYEDDIVPLWETPATVDIVQDYSGKLGYSFTLFIRQKHGKLMFKIFGLPDVSYIPLADRFDKFASPYWQSVIGGLVGFHAYRINGSSLRGVSGTSLYLKAVLDYQYRPVFGINVPLSLVEVDHEFKLNQRESMLAYNANSIVKDRVLNSYYINNNLTEEAQRDNSPLGEENNARYAIRLSKVLALFVERYIGEPNNAVTRSRITAEISAFIENFRKQSQNRLVDYQVICDESNNTEATIANNELHIRVEVRFAKSLKYVVVFEKVLMST